MNTCELKSIEQYWALAEGVHACLLYRCQANRLRKLTPKPKALRPVAGGKRSATAGQSLRRSSDSVLEFIQVNRDRNRGV